jgi:hypothetical protein
MSEQEQFFPIDGEIVRYLHRGGSSVKNRDAQRPQLRQDEDGWFLEMRFEANPEDPEAIELIRRIPLDNPSEEDWKNLQHWYQNLDFQKCISEGISNSLEEIADTKMRRLFLSLLTFLNPRQVAILIYMYKAADIQGKGPNVYFESNDLLKALGYALSNDGRFPSNVRSQINCDLVAMHRMELVFPNPIQVDPTRTSYLVRSILKITEYVVEKGGRKDFDGERAADYTTEMADGYWVSLGFFETIERGSDYLLLSKDINLRQKPSGQSSRDYKMKMFTYLLGRVEKERLTEGQALTVFRSYLFKILELYGSNSSRNNSILWEVLNELINDKIIQEAKEIVKQTRTKRNQPYVQIRLNPNKLKLVTSITS